MFKYGKFLLVWWCADRFAKESQSSVPLVGITLGFWWQPGLCHALVAPYPVGRYMGQHTRYWQENRGMKMGQWTDVPAEVWVFRLLYIAGIFILQKTGLLWRMCNANLTSIRKDLKPWEDVSASPLVSAWALVEGSSEHLLPCSVRDLYSAL